MRLASTLTALLATAATLGTALPAQAAAPALQIVKIYYDSPGADRRSNSSLNAEYITLLNTTGKAVALEGWSVRDKTGYTYEFGADVLLAAKKRITLRTGQGSDGSSSVYWNRKQYVWNNDQDTAYVLNRGGKLVDSCSYKARSTSAYVNC
ncbi:lamin tail domain-containing protein [[Actinomadura] parvosata]|uniref:lamin tail domain-containing protein n=1 Tax=[Actinomadura] parvosata TaxID=1955412 RepID=UPI00406CF597